MDRALHGCRALIGKVLPGFTAALRGLEFGKGSQINVPIAVLIWVMITPMMMKVDFSFDQKCRTASDRAHGDAARELGDQAFFDGVARLGVFPYPLWCFHLTGRSGSIHRRLHHPGSRSLHGYGLRLESSHQWRSGLHARASLGQRSHHAGAVRADRTVPSARCVPAQRSLCRAAHIRDRLHRRAAYCRDAAARPVGRQVWRRLVRRRAAAQVRTGHNRRAARHACVHFRVSGGQHHRPAFARVADWHPDHASGLFQCRHHLYVDEVLKVEHSVAAPGALIGASNFFELAVATAIALFGPPVGRCTGHGGRRPG